MHLKSAVHRLGSATITQVRELDPWIVNPRTWFPTITNDQLAAARTRYPAVLHGNGQMVCVVSTYVVQLGDKVIVIDTGIGNNKSRPGEPDMNMLDTDYLNRLVHNGFDPARVDIVINTHLHPDHCGWNTRWLNEEWVPTYPNARYLFHRVEVDHLRALTATVEDGHGGALFSNLYTDSVEPIIRQARWGLVAPEDIIADCNGTTVIAVNAPGHTPGHLAVEISDGSQTFLMTGDAFHHPLQLDFPDLPMFADADTPTASRTRADLLNRCATGGTRLLTSHFRLCFPIGVKQNHQGGFRWTAQF
ncbi:beta-lactamase-like protein [Mycobacteroides abscessus]|nr:beta-lactamase-like protein [Mycobacteroides abscessus]